MSSAPGQNRLRPGSAECSMGLELFYTTSTGVGGKLRKRTEDFVVEEVSMYPAPVKPPKTGRFSVAKVKAFNWETNRLVKRLARDLNIRSHKVHFAGTKDKRGITTQLMSFEASPEDLKDLRIPDVTISDVYTSNHRLKLGRLYGNKFDILLSNPDLEGKALEEAIKETQAQLEELNGFPNFFGVQRFGAVRPITHNVGKYIVQRKFEEAVWEYIGRPLPGDTIGFEVRTNLVKTRDLESALQEYPKELEFERAMIRYLIDNPEDYIGALRRFPQNLLAMFVHSYQSYIFNLILCARIERGISLTEPQPGDLVLPVDKDGLPIHTEWYEVTVDNRKKLTKLVGAQRAFISGLVFGSETEFASGVQGEIEHEFINREKLVPDDFVIPELLPASSSGIRRELAAPVSNFELEITEDSARFKFQLNKGTYATSLLREYMKTEAINY
ncbi:MAG: tRNA pseudouridine(13) synthase TruD [Thermoplasmata archaeon]|nr:MAG: tRNA pseudouridine(13) synthase TruD [Thermoplasmata archaeon]